MAIWINEFHYDNAGTDSNEHIEVAGTAGTDLTGWKLIMYNGGSAPTAAVVYDTIALSGLVPDQANGLGTVRFLVPGMQNGAADGFALVDNTGNVVQFLSYQGTITAANTGTPETNPAAGMTSTDVGVAESTTTPVGTSLQLRGAGNQYSDFEWVASASATAGQLNNNQNFTSVGPDTTPPKIATASVTNLNKAADIVLRVNETITLTDAAKVRLLDGDQNAVAATVTLDGQNLRIDPTADLGESKTYQVVIDAGALADTAANPIDATTVSVTTAAPPTIARIHDIQGAGAASPMAGQTVTVEAIVFGDFQNGDADAKRDMSGFFMQEEKPNHDNDAATSEGIFIYQGSGAAGVNVNAGDRVQVTGVVSEFNGMTQITATQVTVVQANAVSDVVAALAVDISLPAAGVITANNKYQADLEAYESMLVRVSEKLTITEQFDLDRYNQITLTAGDRPFQYTADHAPDAAGYDAHLKNLAAHQIVYDDGLSVQNASIDNLDGFAGYSTATAPRMGDTIDGLTGVLDFYSNAWRIRAIEDGTVTVNKTNVRQDAPTDVGGTLKVAGLNVLNYFTTLNANGNTVNGLEPRGANTAAELDRQTTKLVKVLATMDADVIGLAELQNNFIAGDAGNAVEYLVKALNTHLDSIGRGNEAYDWVRPGMDTVGGDAISPGFIYRSSSVKIAANSDIAILNDEALASLDGGQAILDRSELKGQNGSGRLFEGENASRNSIAVTFEEIATGETFTAVANHLKSKGSGPSTGDNADQADGAGAWNLQRTLAAEAITLWLKSNPTKVIDADQVLLGDFNAYAKETPVTTLEKAGFENLENRLTDPYSYVFDGQLGALDYVFASSSLKDNVTNVTQWHINSDDADAIDYNLDFNRDASYFDGGSVARVSDHDPVIVGLDLAKKGTTPTTPTDPTTPPVLPSPVGAPIAAPIGGGTATGTSGSDRLVGSGGNDILIGGGGADVLNGGTGLDMAMFAANRADVTTQLGANGLPASVTVNGFTSTLEGVERLVFQDMTLAFDVDAAPGQTYRLYEALLGRAPDREGISFWVDALDSNPNALQSVVTGFLNSPEFQARVGNTAQMDNTAYVDMLYMQVFNRAPDAQGRAFWREALDRGLSRTDLVLNFSESVEHADNVAPVLLQGIELAPMAA